MDIEEVLGAVRDGRSTVREARRLLSIHAVEEVEGFARLDAGRAARRGIPEVVLAESKTREEVRKIAARALAGSGRVLVSRTRRGEIAGLGAVARGAGAAVHRGRNSTSVLLARSLPRPRGTVGILAAGTSDIGVAEEARLMCMASGCRCTTAYDVGVAGMQRVFPAVRGALSAGAGCIIAAAGMEGALATLVASLVDVPVVGLPVSVGYGYGRGGVAALASMLQGCPLGMAVVNIDGGIAAGAIASSIARGAARRPRRRYQG
ncbi:conserved hypothetical protein [Nitrosopumilaceae archaeon]|nr:nickel pincer cofactor biosynthesis protein LarB [Nitrosopumilus sp.]CAI9832742.1 conserved hypothetical protein [Nitrosopumilaceae archaeon]MDA7945399.1 nickel pincer cofactor biosynthesis protein LarB [Nitrosopumilus sp.]MDA7955079.1 nickel pincer cofactor biosynthesis protein LarB [Nitrosopumilus sp.]MDA7959970.1 nickel pincer cofactor biosynthesis protein LarB [Nitrosopumilus sp.]